jgi:DNA-directed RNA polymerase specialized sigma24 family protein
VVGQSIWKGINGFRMAASIAEVPLPQLKTDRIQLPGTEQPASGEQDRLDQFAHWFPRCRSTLYFIASLILGSSVGTEDAVRRCRIKAARNLRNFESEGFFRSWIVRILINEALSILYRNAPKRLRHTPSIFEASNSQTQNRRIRP